MAWLQVAWRYETHDEFPGSEMQSHPIVDGVLYATTPTLRVIALNMVFAATGSAAFDFYGANRHGDNLFANSVIALDARAPSGGAFVAFALPVAAPAGRE